VSGGRKGKKGRTSHLNAQLGAAEADEIEGQTVHFLEGERENPRRKRDRNSEVKRKSPVAAGPQKDKSRRRARNVSTISSPNDKKLAIKKKRNRRGKRGTREKSVEDSKYRSWKEKGQRNDQPKGWGFSRSPHESLDAPSGQTIGARQREGGIVKKNPGGQCVVLKKTGLKIQGPKSLYCPTLRR